MQHISHTLLKDPLDIIIGYKNSIIKNVTYTGLTSNYQLVSNCNYIGCEGYQLSNYDDEEDELGWDEY